MEDMNPRPSADPCKREYHLKCKVKFVKNSILVKEDMVERKMAILIPEFSDQRTYFLSAWLPDLMPEGVPPQHYELVGYIPYPIDSNCRFSIHRGPDKYNDKHYLFVMTKGVEDILISGKLEGKKISVRILSEDAEETADSVRDNDSGLEVYNES